MFKNPLANHLHHLWTKELRLRTPEVRLAFRRCNEHRNQCSPDPIALP